MAIRVYRLKAMVLARLLAELTVLVALIAIPIVLLFMGKFQNLHLAVRCLFGLMGAGSLVLLPVYGFMNWQVKADLDGLTVYSLFKRQTCQWSAMKSLARRSSWNWQRFVIDYEGGSLNFPVLLAKVDELVQTIRNHLPQQEPVGLWIGGDSRRVFKYDYASLVMGIGQSVLALLFTIIFCIFATTTMHQHAQYVGDRALVLFFCVILILVVLWRLFVTLTMPKAIEVLKNQIVWNSLFTKKNVEWQDVISVTAPMPLLPEGFIIKTKRGTIFVGSGMDAADELQQLVKDEISRRQIEN